MPVSEFCRKAGISQAPAGGRRHIEFEDRRQAQRQRKRMDLGIAEIEERLSLYKFLELFWGDPLRSPMRAAMQHAFGTIRWRALTLVIHVVGRPRAIPKYTEPFIR